MHSVGVLAMTVEASLTAFRTFNAPSGITASLVDARGLDLPSGALQAMQDWPLQDDSVFAIAERRQLLDAAFRPREVLDEMLYGQLRLYRPIEPFVEIADAFAITFPLLDSRWYMALFVRCGRQRPFSPADLDLLERMKPAMANLIRPAFAHDLRMLTHGSDPQSLGAAPHGNRLDAAGMLLRLTRTERRIYELLRTTATERQIAQNLHRSPHTIHVHVKSIYRKLNVRSRRELQEHPA
ncbi:MAG: hypothetical protein IT440_10695 [Phycisphaeraceae bacterium]|nr:hypothetical protein [Phycisphaeraceae bacterium]